MAMQPSKACCGPGDYRRRDHEAATWMAEHFSQRVHSSDNCDGVVVQLEAMEHNLMLMEDSSLAPETVDYVPCVVDLVDMRGLFLRAQQQASALLVDAAEESEESEESDVAVISPSDLEMPIPEVPTGVEVSHLSLIQSAQCRSNQDAVGATGLCASPILFYEASQREAAGDAICLSRRRECSASSKSAQTSSLCTTTCAFTS